LYRKEKKSGESLLVEKLSRDQEEEDVKKDTASIAYSSEETSPQSEENSLASGGAAQRSAFPFLLLAMGVSIIGALAFFSLRLL